MILEYNLQFFAKDGPGGEKTEKPTAKKRQKAREEGQVAKSNEISTGVGLLIGFSALGLFSTYMLEKFKDVFYNAFALFQYTSQEDLENGRFAGRIISDGFGSVIQIILPIMVICFGTGLLVAFLQVGWKPTTKPLKPNFGKLNPLKGFQRIFSLKSIVELIKSLLKLGIITFIIYSVVQEELPGIMKFFDLTLQEIAMYLIKIAVRIGTKVGMFYMVVAALDYAYQKFQHEKNLKMTKQEIKEEYKMAEGNPEIKRQIKQKMREVSMRRMMQDLPKADVVITNPTHFAVAISYDAESGAAPVVLGKGADLIAQRIKEVARENTIEIVENKPLARTLYYTVEIGDEIPPELYQAVAEVLAFVYRLKHGGV